MRSLWTVVSVMLAACQPGPERTPPPLAELRDTASPPSVRSGSPQTDTASRSLPRTGLAVADSGNAWCAEFMIDSTAPPLHAGQRLTIVFAGPAALPAWRARVRGPRASECPASFPQPRWAGYAAYDLELLDSHPSGRGETPTVALVVVSEVPWVRGVDGVVRADLDGDGWPEEGRRCSAGEGEHLTLWSRQADGGHVRRWHEYFDWGGRTDPTCRPGEDGEEPSTIGRS